MKELGFISRRAQDIFLQNVYAGSGPHLALCYVDTLCLFPRGKVGGGVVKLTTRYSLVQRLRISGAIPHLPHVFLAWAGAPLPNFLYFTLLE